MFISWFLCLSISHITFTNAHAPSKHTSREFKLELLNDLRTTIRLNWINFNGHSIFVKSIHAGDKYSLKSFFNHKWVIESDQKKDIKFELGEHNLLYSGSRYKVSQLMTTAATNKPTPNRDSNKPKPNVDWNRPRPNVNSNRPKTNVDWNRQKPNVDWNRQKTNIDRNRPKTNVDSNRSKPNGVSNRPKSNVDWNRQKPNRVSNRPEALNSCAVTFQNKMLELHNYKRAMHRANPLRIDNSLTRSAVDLSKRMSQMDTLNSYTQVNRVGQNLGMIYNSAFNLDNPSICTEIAVKTFDTWYKGEKLYNYYSGIFGTDTGAFTQIVWASTTDIGCGFSCTKSKHCYVTCHYKKAGNVFGQFLQNVSR